MTTAKQEVTFEEPPPQREQRYDWNAIAEQLRAHPMEWARIFDEDRTSIVTAIRINGVKALSPNKGFEVRTTNNRRGEGRRTCTLYLRYNPDREVSDDGPAEGER